MKRVAAWTGVGLVVMLSGAVGCRMHPPPAAEILPPLDTAPAEPSSPAVDGHGAAPAMTAPRVATLMAQADIAASAGDLPFAVFLLHEALLDAEALEADQVTVALRLALLHADPLSPVRDAALAEEELGWLEDHHPGVAAGQARAVRNLLGRTAELQGQVETLTGQLRAVEASLQRREAEMKRIKEILLEEKEPG